MRFLGALLARASGLWRKLTLVAAGVLLAASLIACNGDSGSANDERILELGAKAHSLEESIEALQDENSKLREEIGTLRQEQADFVQAQEAAEAAREHQEEVADFGEGQEERLGALEGAQDRNEDHFFVLDSRVQDLETVASKVDLVLPAMEKWFTGMDKRLKLLEGTDLERTVSLAEAAGGEVYYIDHPDREEPAVLVMPLEPIEGNPLIVSLHGFGGNSADHSIYVPLHERVIRDGFGLLLPNGMRNAEGQRFWNPTDQDSGSSKVSQDDVAYLSHLVVEAQMLKEFGPVYFFGHSNGGFMSYWIACRGLPGLRAVASLAGTSYVEDAACQGAPPVSVLHIHGSADNVVLFEGMQAESDKDGPGYAGAPDMVRRWGERAGCEWPEEPQPYASLDLDQYVPGSETHAFRLESGCAEGINIELWAAEGSGHGPSYGDAFVDALLDWLLTQK